jgi:arylsulfatase A-like enzyme
VIFGDDIGVANVSAYTHGLVGYRTPNIDRIAREGMMFTDYYAEQSCTAGRSAFITGNDEGSLVALRYNQWKIVFAEQREEGQDVWQEPFVELRAPKLFNLRSDPFEEADHVAMDYGHWRTDRVFVLVPAQEYIAKYIATFKEFPPSQKVGSFSLDQVLQKLQQGGGGQK